MSLSPDNKNTIVITATSNYRNYLYAFLQSARVNLFEKLYKIVIIHGGLERDVVEKTEKIARGHFHLSFYNIHDYSNKDAFGDLLRSPAYWRFIAPQVVEGAERVFYVDLDTLILGDLSSLFTHNLHGNTIGACLDYLPEVQDGVNNWQELRLDPHAPYFNSGVLLIDIHRYKEKKVSERVLEIVTKNCDHLLAKGKWPQNDQYGLNVALISDWLVLPMYYNYGSGLKNRHSEIKILHFIGAGKPFSEKCKPEFTTRFLGYLEAALS